MMNAALIIRYGDFAEYLFRDLIENPEVNTFYLNKPIKNGPIRFIHKIHTSHKINNVIALPFKEIWNPIRPMVEQAYRAEAFIFIISSLECVDLYYLQSFKKAIGERKMVLVITDSMNAHSNNLSITKPLIFGFDWDLILSYDKEDCLKYNFTYFGFSYYSFHQDDNQESNVYDLYSIFNRKHGEESREKLLAQIAKACAQNNITSKLTLVIGANKIPTNTNNIEYLSKGIAYKEIIHNINKSNCILELLQPGQHQQTVRYFEAVCYNKKLLTNNENIYSLPYYDERYMKVFKKVDDIDFEWIKKEENIDYHYTNDFSPNELLNIIHDYFT